MRENFSLKSSISQLALLLAGHAAAALLCIAYLHPGWLQLGGASLFLLLGWRDAGRLHAHADIEIELDTATDGIRLKQGGQPYFYAKYKVYANRWFAILKLIDEHDRRTLILNPERFKSIDSYRHLRYLLQRQGADSAA